MSEGSIYLGCMPEIAGDPRDYRSVSKSTLNKEPCRFRNRREVIEAY
jgi:hypothetical protein